MTLAFLARCGRRSIAPMESARIGVMQARLNDARPGAATGKEPAH